MAITLKDENIPDELKVRPQWICWQGKQLDNGKLSKIPVDPKTGQAASTTDSTTWGEFAEALDNHRSGKADGIGFVFTKDDPYFGIDLDGCVNANGKPETWFVGIVKLLRTYTEITVSRRGLHIIGRGKLPPGGRRKGQIEMYDEGRSFVMTGDILPKDDFRQIRDRSAEIITLHKQIFGGNGQSIKTMPQPESPPVDIITKAMNAKNGGTFSKLWRGDFSGYPSQSEADQALCNLLAFWTGKDPERMDSLFRQSKLFRPKWNEKHYGDGRTYGQATVENAIKMTSDAYNPERTVIEAPLAATPEKIEPEKGITLPFPDEIMTGAAGEFAAVYSSYLEPARHFFFMAYLVCLGSIIADRVFLQSEISPQPRLYLLLLGESADDRKSTVITKTVDFYRSVLSDYGVCWGVGSAEGLQKELEKRPRLLLAFDEFKSFVSKCQIESSVLLSCVNTLFESDHYESHTQKRSVVLNGVSVSVLAASTIATYERTWDPSFTDIGFNNRLFLVPGKGARRFSFPERIPLADRKRLQVQLIEVINFIGERREFDITQEARDLYERWYLDLETSVHSKRLDTYAMRFMQLLAANEKRAEIDAGLIKKVTDLMDWQLRVRRLHDPIDADNKIAGMEEKIRRVLGCRDAVKEAKSERDVKRYAHVDKTGLWVFETAKNNLIRAQEIEFDPKTRKLIGL